MKLGIMVTTDRFAAQIRGIVEAALRGGHTVALFATGDGVTLVSDRGFASLSALPGVAIGYCEHSLQSRGGRPASTPAAVVAGSQFDNATLVSESDRVVVL